MKRRIVSYESLLLTMVNEVAMSLPLIITSLIAKCSHLHLTYPRDPAGTAQSREQMHAFPWMELKSSLGAGEDWDPAHNDYSACFTLLHPFILNIK